MECLDHKGRDMNEIYKESAPCEMCGSAKPPELVGYQCMVDGKMYNLKGQPVDPQGSVTAESTETGTLRVTEPGQPDKVLSTISTEKTTSTTVSMAEGETAVAESKPESVDEGEEEGPSKGRGKKK